MRLLVSAFILVASGLFCASCRSTHDQGSTLTPEEGYDRLVEARCFALGPVGASADTSAGELGFLAVLRSRNPPAVFRLVLSRGTEEGKLYGLCGIRATDRTSFASYAVMLARTNAEVRTLSGCIGGHERAADVVNRIAAGVYDQYFTKR